MALQHLQDGAFEGVELAGAFCRFPGHESMLCQPLGDRAGIEFQFPGDLGRGRKCGQGLDFACSGWTFPCLTVVSGRARGNSPRKLTLQLTLYSTCPLPVAG